VTYVYTAPQGTPLAEADASGNITATFDYAPYGSQALGTPPDGPGYTGHVNDPESGLVYMQARYYDPATGRFLSTDPVEHSAGALLGFNRYDYASNNPIANVDPNGKQEVPVETPRPDEGVDAAGSPLEGPNMADASPFRAMPGESSSDFASRQAYAFERMDSTPEKNAADDAKAGLIAKGILPKAPPGRGTVPKSERDPKRFFTPSESQAKRTEQGNKCGNGCGKTIDQSNSRGHHIVRHADGGRTVSENHSEVCVDCHVKIHAGEKE